MDKPVVREDEKIVRRMPASQLMPLYLASMRSRGSVTIPVSGSSMTPFLCHLRDSVTLRPIEGRSVGLGDVVLYTRRRGDAPPKYVMHRVVGKKGGAFVMCGDAQTEREPGVARGDLLAVAVAVNRRGREVTPKSPVWFFYKHIWRLLRPFRGAILALRGRLKRRSAGGEDAR